MRPAVTLRPTVFVPNSRTLAELSKAANRAMEDGGVEVKSGRLVLRPVAQPTSGGMVTVAAA